MKIGSLDISAFKVGATDCSIYLGDTLLYPQSTTPNYFRFVAREDGQFKLSGNSVSYSLDSGTTWVELQSDTYSPTVSSGNCIMLKATNPTLVSGGGIGSFFSSGQFDVEGNIMSLIYGDDFETATTLTNNGQFRSLFDSNTNVINASGLTIPSSNVPQDGYRSMFHGCSNLVTAPTVFPATTLGESCYKYTFSGCTSLTTAPELPATNLAQSCYASMFRYCTSLTSVPSNYLPATTLQTQCYEYMFSNCTSLTTAPSELPATTLADRCYEYMFGDCTNLTTAPELPATTLANRCYRCMFIGCTSLTTAPVLPATTLAVSAYTSMFIGCTNLTTAPELPATTLASYCYQYMFYNCTSLNYIKCLATNISAINCTTNWVYGVAASGTFVKDASMTDWTVGVKGIPSGWTVQDDTHDYSLDYFTMNITTGGNIKWSGSTTANTLSYSKDNGQTWATADRTTTISVNVGDKVLWKGTPQTSNSIGKFSGDTDVRYSVEGNAMSLLFGDNFVNQTSLSGKDYVFYGLFYNNTNVTSAENMILPATTLADRCYQAMFYRCESLTTAPELPATALKFGCYEEMFYGCTSLTTAPELPATTLAWDCYSLMFYNCTSLTTAPELPATTLAQYCYYCMFEYCSSLNYIKCLATDISANSCTNSWVSGVSASGTFVKAASMTGWTTGNNGIPSGWTVEDDTHDYSLDYFTIVSEANNNTVSIVAENSAPSITVSASTDNGQTWTEYTGGTIATLNTDDKVLLKGVNNALTSSNGNNTIVATASFHVEGNTMSLLFGGNFSGQTSLSSRNYALAYLFKGVTTLTSAENMILPATTLAERCYTNMFEGCTSLTTAPELPATTLTKDCYNWMFYGCTSLTTAPELSATTLASFCYSAMFSGCTSLTTAPELPATSLVDNCYRKMFKDCSSLNYIKCLARQYNANSYTLEWVSNVAATGTFVKAANMSSWGTGISGIPSGWTVQNAS